MRIRMLLLLSVFALGANACATGSGQISKGISTKAAGFGSGMESAPVTRSEAADLLVQGLSLPERLACDPSEYSKPELQLPSTRSGPCPPPLPRDAVGSTQIGAVVFVVCIELRGLEVRPDGRFEPDRPVRRAEWALALGDVVERLGVPTASPGTAQTAFTDVPKGHFAHGAVVRVTALDLMELREGGRFEPMGSVTQSEALVSIQRLQGLLEAE